MKSLLLALMLFIPSLFACSQTYKIDVKISDLKDSDIYLGYYYGQSTYVKDTVRLDSKGEATFKGDSLLEQGIYIIVLPSKNYFDLLIGSDQEFSLETSSDKLMENLKIKGSKESIAFRDFQMFMMEQNKQSMEIQGRIRSLDSKSDSVKFYREQMDVLSEKVQTHIDKTISENDGNMLGIIVKLMKNPEIPEITVPDEIENKDSVRWFHSYNYNLKHYFDQTDFADKRYLFTPVFHNKLETFFTKILIQNPDTIIKYIDIVAQKAEPEKDMYRYVLQYLINTFAKSDIMGMDKVFVHVAENYYLTDKVDWLDDTTIDKIKEQVAKLRFNLIGNTAQDLKMETLNGEYSRLSDINSKFTLVMFWEPDCGHCKKVVPAVYKLYHEYTRDEFDVFAVYTQTNREEWAKYIEEKGFDEWHNVWDQYNLTNFRFFYNIYSTPTLYLLDENKKIIAKRIGHETLKNILDIELGKKKISDINFEEEKEHE